MVPEAIQGMIFSWWLAKAQETEMTQASTFTASVHGVSADVSLAIGSQMAKPQVNGARGVGGMCTLPALPTATKTHGKRAWVYNSIMGKFEKEGKKIILPGKSD